MALGTGPKFGPKLDLEKFLQPIFWSKNKKIMYTVLYPCKPQFYYIKVGCNGVYITWT